MNLLSLRAAGLVLPAGLLSGCFVPAYTTTVRQNADLHGQNASPRTDEELARQAAALPWNGKYDIPIYESEMPEGLRLAANNSGGNSPSGSADIEIIPGFEGRWQVLGEIESSFK